MIEGVRNLDGTTVSFHFFFFFFNDPAPTEIYPLSLHDALPISAAGASRRGAQLRRQDRRRAAGADPQPASRARGLPGKPCCDLSASAPDMVVPRPCSRWICE